MHLWSRGIELGSSRYEKALGKGGRGEGDGTGGRGLRVIIVKLLTLCFHYEFECLQPSAKRAQHPRAEACASWAMLHRSRAREWL